MEDILKRFLYTGVGLAALTAEKLQESVDELVNKNKLSETEGKKILDDFFNSTEARREEFESKLKESAEQVLDRISLPTKVEVEELQQRVEQLEAEVEALKAQLANQA